LTGSNPNQMAPNRTSYANLLYNKRLKYAPAPQDQGMLTFLEFIKTASKKTITFTSAEVRQMREQVGDAVLELGDLQQDGSMVVSVGYLIEAAHALTTPGPTDLIEFSKQGYFTILLDANLRGLKTALEDDGFKVIAAKRSELIMPQQNLHDDELKHEAKGCAILTQNSQDFIDDAVRFDYDVIGVEAIKFIDKKQDRTNQTVRKISRAVRASRIGTKRGNFYLKIHDDGSFVLEALI